MNGDNSNYVLLAFIVILAISFGCVALIASRILSPQKPGRTKNDSYECGLESRGDAWIPFKVQYYLYALLFVIFDIEAIFLYPWAVSFNLLGVFALVEILLFVGILGAGLAYAWKKGALEWR